MKVIHIIEKSTGIVHTKISSLEELYDFFTLEVFGEAFQRRTAVESLLTSHNNAGNSIDRNWQAKLVEEPIKRKRKK
ncbi:MAG: hypothetical protein EBZ58_10465 [Bacteroidetes bacterium]|nr:hypothetical protein [Bacteroidota bacterium]